MLTTLSSCGRQWAQLLSGKRVSLCLWKSPCKLGWQANKLVLRPPFILTCIVYPCGTGTPRSTSSHKRSTSSHKVTCKPKSPQDSGESSNGRPQQLSCLESPVRKQVIKKRTCSVSSPVPPKAATHRRRHKCGFSLLAAAPRPAHSAQFLEDTLSGTAYAVRPLQPVSVGTAHPLLSQIHPSKAHAWPGSSPTSDLKCMVTLED